MVTRRRFFGTAAAAAAGAFATRAAGQDRQPRAQPGPAPEPAKHARGKIFANATFDYTARTALGSSYYGCANPGKVFAIASAIQDGDYESGYKAFLDAGSEARAWAEEAAAKGRRVSAREAYLWSANYLYASLYFLDGADPDRMLPTWKQYEHCWTAAAALSRSAIERVEIPYEGTTLTGWFFRAAEAKQRRPLVILNNGSDASELAMLVAGGTAGNARGYNCLTFNGPGQGDSLWLKHMYFRPDWEKAITPVVDFAVVHPEVDAKRIALVGISQGGYWVPRALAFEHRIAAGVADPGVWNVGRAWTRRLPQAMMALLADGEKERFDEYLTTALRHSPEAKATLAFRMRPYGTHSYYEAFRAVQQYNLKDVAGQIQCPMLITNPEAEQFFPGQASELCDMLRCQTTLVDFTADQGAQLHCEVNAPGYRDLRIYNWLDPTLKIRGSQLAAASSARISTASSISTETKREQPGWGMVTP
ncbi:MAG: alpha/beta hydrolase family protein [Terriglobales bacterium]